MTVPKDRFSDVAKEYAKFRPRYPDELYAFLYPLVKYKHRAWDVGTGNGQVAHVLGNTFREVIATDISASQIGQAIQATNVTYRLGMAEVSGIEDRSIDLITTAQAAHWFDLPAFAKEVARVSVPNAVLGLWGYTLLSCEPKVDDLIQHLYADILQGFWDTSRDLVNRRYRDVDFPFEEIPCPDFEIHTLNTADDILGYLRSWSAVNKYRKARGQDPVRMIEDALVSTFAGRRLRCHTPVFLRAWRIH